MTKVMFGAQLPGPFPNAICTGLTPSASSLNSFPLGTLPVRSLLRYAIWLHYTTFVCFVNGYLKANF